MVHTARDGIRAGLGAGAHERQRSGGLVGERRGELDRALVVGLGERTAHEHHDRLDLAADGERQQQRAAGLARRHEPGQRRLQLTGVGGEEAARGVRDPADAGRAIGAGRQIAETSVALEQVHDHRLLLGGRPEEMVHVHLLGTRRQQQLPRQPSEDLLAVSRAVGEQRQAPHTREHRVRARRI